MVERGRTLQEVLKEGRLADKIDRERAELWKAMLRTEGWRLYQEMLSARIQIFGEHVLTPAASVDGLVAMEYVKGAMSGLVMARDLPGIVVGVVEQGMVGEGDEHE